MNRADFLSAVRGWTGFTDTSVHSDALIDSWILLTEERCSRELRVGDMIDIDTATVVVDRAPVPDDWRANDFVRLVDGKELRFLARPEFYALNNRRGYYTTTGRFIIVGEAAADNSIEVELHYFADVPHLESDETWLSTRFLTILTSGVMVFASARMKDTEEETKWEGRFNKYVLDANNEYKASLGSGGRLNRRLRSLG